MRLLVAFDGSDGGRDALELTRVLATSAQDPSALVVSVLFLVSGPMSIEHPQLSAEEEAAAAPLFEEALEKLTGIDVETRGYGGGSPAEVLTMLAEEEDFDAIVIGSPHRGAVGRVMIGSVAMNLLSGAPADVAVAPRGYAEAKHETLREIAVGYDGAPEAKVALRRAERLARPSNARIKLLTVVTPPVATPAMVPGTYSPEYPPEPERVVQEGLDSIEAALAAESTRLDGDPATELARECEESVDLLVVGSRGYGPLARVLLGSVSRKIAGDAPCPLLVVRRP